MILTFRKPGIDDARLYFNWANDELVRQNAVNSEQIIWENHKNWFSKKINDNQTIMLMFTENSRPVGQIRIDVQDKEGVIDYSVDEKYRGKGFGTAIIRQGADFFSMHFKDCILTGLVKATNLPSIAAFKKAGFKIKEEAIINGSNYIKFIKQ